MRGAAADMFLIHTSIQTEKGGRMMALFGGRHTRSGERSALPNSYDASDSKCRIAIYTTDLSSSTIVLFLFSECSCVWPSLDLWSIVFVHRISRSQVGVLRTLGEKSHSVPLKICFIEVRFFLLFNHFYQNSYNM